MKCIGLLANINFIQNKKNVSTEEMKCVLEILLWLLLHKHKFHTTQQNVSIEEIKCALDMMLLFLLDDCPN